VSKKQLLHVAHTLVAVLIGLAPFAPELVARLGVPTTAGVGATIVAVSAGLVKASQIPVVRARLKAWLA
jgi:hypothetical protein